MKYEYNKLLDKKLQKTPDNLTDLTSRSHTDLTSIGTNTHTQIDNHLSAFEQGTAQITVGNSFVDVPHTLGQVPSSYAIVSDIYDGAIFYIDNETAMNFRINILVPQYNTITYKWRIWK